MEIYLVIEEVKYYEIDRRGYVKVIDRSTSFHKCCKDKQEAERYCAFITRYNEENKIDGIKRKAKIKVMELE